MIKKILSVLNSLPDLLIDLIVISIISFPIALLLNVGFMVLVGIICTAFDMPDLDTPYSFPIIFSLTFITLVGNDWYKKMNRRKRMVRDRVRAE